jgi:glutamyl-tRNA synthetase
MKQVRVRFAPSPTGPLHIGGVRTALYNYLFAKKHNGKFILRIEDTDTNRFVPGAEAYIIEAFNWLGLPFDEGVSFGGNYGPYRQSERKEIYKIYVKELLDKKLAYIAFDTPEELDKKREEIANFQYDATTRMHMCNSLTLSENEVKERLDNGDKYVVRIHIEPNQDIIVQDIIRGEVKINSSVLDDKVLYKSADELPTYHLANIVDDHLMEISHVIRGEEWLPSAPLHVLLYRCFGWEETMPQFAHLPLLLKPDGNGKLSKRDGDRLGFPVFPLQWTDPKTGDISAGYRENGYFPEAVVNFLALLGWNNGTEQEVFSLEELVHQFSLDRVSKSGAKFDYEKGKWFNHHYLIHQSNETLAKLFALELEKKGIHTTDNKLIAIIALVKERAHFVADLWEQASFFFVTPTAYDEKAVQKRWKENTASMLSELAKTISAVENTEDSHATEETVKQWVEGTGYGLGNVMNPFRLALVGELKGPHLFDIVAIIGKEETLKRIQKAIETLG